MGSGGGEVVGPGASGVCGCCAEEFAGHRKRLIARRKKLAWKILDIIG